MWPEPPWAPLRDSAWLGDLEPVSHVCYLTAAPTTVCRFMCRIRFQAKGFRVSGVKFWEAAVVIGLKLCKRFGFSIFMKSAVIEVEGACQCDLGRSPVTPHLRSLSGRVTVVRGALCMRLWVWRLWEKGSSGQVGVWGCTFSLASPPSPRPERGLPAKSREGTGYQNAHQVPSGKKGFAQTWAQGQGVQSRGIGDDAFFPPGREDEREDLASAPKWWFNILL